MHHRVSYYIFYNYWSNHPLSGVTALSTWDFCYSSISFDFQTVCIKIKMMRVRAMSHHSGSEWIILSELDY